MSRFDWLPEFLARCEDQHIPVSGNTAQRLAPAHLIVLDPEGWGRMAMVAREQGCHWSALWVEQTDAGTLQANAVLVFRGDYLMIRTGLPEFIILEIIFSHSFHPPFYEYSNCNFLLCKLKHF